nr:hypothetical protein [Tanacetum cinerariifolium]
MHSYHHGYGVWRKVIRYISLAGYGVLAEAIATTCFTQNHSLVIPRHEKTPYHTINGQKPFVKFFHIFGSLCYIVRDGENLEKIKEKGDACICVGYSTQSRAYRVYNKRTRVIVKTIHVNFDELPQMVSDHVSFDPVPQCPTTTLEHDRLSPNPQSQEKVPHTASIVTTSNELDFLFSLMFDELLNGTTPVVSKSSAVNAVDAPDKRQQQNITQSSTTTVAAEIPLFNIQTTPETTSLAPTQAPTITTTDSNNQAETNKENAQVKEDEFIKIFCIPVQERREASSRHVASSNMHTFYQRHPSKHCWTKDHPLEQVIRNPSQSITARRQLEIDGEMRIMLTKTELTLEQPQQGVSDDVLVPDPLELEDHVPVYIPEPVYLEYLAPSDDEIPTEYLPTDASLIALSSSYIGDSDPEEDEEILEEDHVDYPVDKEDDDDESSDDDDVEEDDEEEEH